MKNHRVGPTQVAFMKMLLIHGSYFPLSGWVWKNRSLSYRLAISLVKRGFAEQFTLAGTRAEGFRLNQSGRDHLAKLAVKEDRGK